MSGVTITIPTGRILNLPWDARSSCSTCQDDAWVVVSVRKEGKATAEELGPCPKCARGFCREFAYGRRKVAKGTVEMWEDYQGRPIWGRDGFWSQHPEALAAFRPVSDSGPLLSDEENERRMRVMGRIMVSGSTPELLDELYRDDPGGRAMHDELVSE